MKLILIIDDDVCEIYCEGCDTSSRSDGGYTDDDHFIIDGGETESVTELFVIVIDIVVDADCEIHRRCVITPPGLTAVVRMLLTLSMKVRW